MTDKQALAKAHKLWGKNAHIEISHPSMKDPDTGKWKSDKSQNIYTVGTVDVMAGLGIFFVRGSSHDGWDAAFEHATTTGRG